MSLRYTVRRVVIAAMAALAVVALSGSLFLIITTSSLQNHIAEEIAHLTIDEEVATRIVEHVERQIDIAALYEAGDPDLLDDFRAEGMLVYENIRLYLFRDLSREERVLVERIRERHERIEVGAQAMFAGQTSSTHALQDVAELRADLGQLLRMRRQHALSLLQQQERTVSRLHLLLGGLGVLFLLLILAVTAFLRRRLVEPLLSMSAAAHRIGAGNFDARVEYQRDDELGAVATSFNRMAERLQAERLERHELESRLTQAQKMEAVGRLAGGIAHDFNNLLTAIEGYADLLRQRVGADDEGGQREVHEIRRAVQRGARLTRQLLAFGRRQVVRPRPIDVSGVVSELEGMLRRVITEDVALVTDLAPDCWVQMDPGQLEQVVMNLVVNARDADPRSAIWITVAAERADEAGSTDNVILSVSDDGCGIAAADVPFIFEPFFTTKEMGRGTGLGLATVYSIVEQSGGRLDVESTAGVGTTFRVRLPAVAAAAHTEAVTPPREEPRGGSELILLVEDEPAVRALADRVLKRHGYHVVAARNGAEALQLAASLAGVIDLLLTDVVMPEMGGVQLADTLARIQPDLRVVFMSGYSPDELPCRAGGAPSYFLEKPFVPASLADVVRRALDESVPVAASGIANLPG